MFSIILLVGQQWGMWTMVGVCASMLTALCYSNVQHVALVVPVSIEPSIAAQLPMWLVKLAAAVILLRPHPKHRRLHAQQPLTL